MAGTIKDIAEIITAIATSVTSITVFIAWKQIKADHERSRRERAVELVFEWAKSLNPKASISRKFAETLNRQDALSLYNQEIFKVEEKYKSLLMGCLECNDTDLQVASGKISLKTQQVSKIRWEVISYLNKLEAILSAWRHNVADKEIIEEEFKYLISPKEGHALLPDFMTAAEDNYPSIKQFAEHLKNTSQAKEGKKKIA